LIAGVATGLHLAPPRGPDDTAGLRRAVHRAIALHAQPAVWRAVQRRGMAADFAWARSAERYASLFRTLRDRQPA
jgi:starch synthase